MTRFKMDGKTYRVNWVEIAAQLGVGLIAAAVVWRAIEIVTGA